MTILIAGIIVLTLTTMGLSMLADGSIGGEKDGYGEVRNMELTDGIENFERSIRSKKKELQKHREAVLRNQERQILQGKELIIEEQLEKGRRANLDLVLAIDETKADLVALAKEHVDYRRAARETLWNRNVGRKVDPSDFAENLNLSNGVITQISHAGMLVRHDGGVLRVKVKQLSPEFRESLDLNEAEARKAFLALFEKDAKLKKAMARIRESTKRQGPPSDVMTEDQLYVRKLRVWELVRLIERAKDEIQYSRSQEAYSKNRSAPASLETWGQRVSRFQAILGRYERQLAKAVIEVQEMEPDFQIR